MRQKVRQFLVLIHQLQHNFFVHSGAIVDADTAEAGTWLICAWYHPANSGFDGRWVQLFDDRP
jgi:hypothetical protein